MAYWIDEQLSATLSTIEWVRQHERADGFVDRVSRQMAECLEKGGRLLTCGNGGSMCDAMHFAEELSGRYRKDRMALAAQAISDPAHLSCVANDFGFDQVFARGVEAWGRRGDCLVVFSTSGNSRNVLAAADAARTREMTVVGLLGREGGAMRERCDHAVIVPGTDSGRIQEAHITIVHLLIEGIERLLVPDHYA